MYCAMYSSCDTLGSASVIARNTHFLACGLCTNAVAVAFDISLTLRHRNRSGVWCLTTGEPMKQMLDSMTLVTNASDTGRHFLYNSGASVTIGFEMRIGKNPRASCESGCELMADWAPSARLMRNGKIVSHSISRGASIGQALASETPYGVVSQTEPCSWKSLVLPFSRSARLECENMLNSRRAHGFGSGSVSSW